MFHMFHGVHANLEETVMTCIAAEEANNRMRYMYYQKAHQMLNPVQIVLAGTDGAKRFVIIEPVLEKIEGEMRPTGEFKIFKDAFGEQSALFTEPLEIHKTGRKLPDNLNPDYLGMIAYNENGTSYYLGDLLNKNEQAQVIEAIHSFL